MVLLGLLSSEGALVTVLFLGHLFRSRAVPLPLQLYWFVYLRPVLLRFTVLFYQSLSIIVLAGEWLDSSRGRICAAIIRQLHLYITDRNSGLILWNSWTSTELKIIDQRFGISNCELRWSTLIAEILSKSRQFRSTICIYQNYHQASKEKSANRCL